jgi:hypothetical protein
MLAGVNKDYDKMITKDEKVALASCRRLEFLHFSRRSRRHIVAHSVSCGLHSGKSKPA